MAQNHGLNAGWCLGVKVDGPGPETLKKRVLEALGAPGQLIIATPNPEMVVKAQSDAYFRDVLNRCFTLCDGFGLYLALHATGRMASRLAGADAMFVVLAAALSKNAGVYLLGSGDQTVVSTTAASLRSQFPKLRIVGFNKGGRVDDPANEKLKLDVAANDRLIQEINNSGAQVLLVAFGMGKQEKWMDEFKEKLPGVKVMIGLGGTFDFVSGKIKRAPLLLQKIGLEWVYRLIKEPSRARRIWNATAKFVFLVLLDAWHKKR